jgi:hypothetical protein
MIVRIFLTLYFFLIRGSITAGAIEQHPGVSTVEEIIVSIDDRISDQVDIGHRTVCGIKRKGSLPAPPAQSASSRAAWQDVVASRGDMQHSGQIRTKTGIIFFCCLLQCRDNPPSCGIDIPERHGRMGRLFCNPPFITIAIDVDPWPMGGNQTF